MRTGKSCLLLCSGLLACSGRYVTSAPDGVGAEPGVGAGATSAAGGTSTAQAGQTALPPPLETGGTFAVGGATSTAGTSAVAGTASVPPPLVDEAACGVPLGQPQAIAAPITSYMAWWLRLSKLIWADQMHAAPPDLSSAISYQQAGQIADDQIEQAIAETKGIPGVTPFVRSWLHLDEQNPPLLVDWTQALSKGPAAMSLLTLRFDDTRVGAFTEPAFLSAHSLISRRGTVMTDALFNRLVPPEPPGVVPPEPPAGLTRRQALAQSLDSPVCSACHRMIDPLGYSLENYDASGKYVTVDAGQPVDASGSYPLPGSGVEIEFKDIGDLGRQLLDTCDANFGLVDQFLLFALAQSGVSVPGPDPSGGDGLEPDRARMRQAFMRSGRTYRSLIKAFAQSHAIRAN